MSSGTVIGLIVVGIVAFVVWAVQKSSARAARAAEEFYTLRPGERVLLHLDATWIDKATLTHNSRNCGSGILCVTTQRVGFGGGFEKIVELRRSLELVDVRAQHADDGKTTYVERSRITAGAEGVVLPTYGQVHASNPSMHVAVHLACDDDRVLFRALVHGKIDD